MIYLASQMLNTTGWNMAGKCGYVWGGTALVCWVMAFFFLPEVCSLSSRVRVRLSSSKLTDCFTVQAPLVPRAGHSI
jgi:SP family general alpha glucoside:H+ symporter-like MFS transporter